MSLTGRTVSLDIVRNLERTDIWMAFVISESMNLILHNVCRILSFTIHIIQIVIIFSLKFTTIYNKHLYQVIYTNHDLDMDILLKEINGYNKNLAR
jgi:hypothetical protein